MADPLSSILNHIANLVSFKSSLRLILIACGVIFSWVYIQPHLKPFDLPDELNVTLITIIGFSLGALISLIIFSVVDLICSFFIKRKNECLEAEKAEEFRKEKEKDIENKVNIFENSIKEFSTEAKGILAKLLLKDQAFSESGFQTYEYTRALSGLISNHSIMILHRIDKITIFCSINPIYRKPIEEYFSKEHRAEVDSLFIEPAAGLETLMSMFMNQTLDADHIFQLGNDIYTHRYHFSPVILHDEYDEDESQKFNMQFWISENHYVFLNEKVGGKLRDYILVNYDEDMRHTIKC